MKKQIYPSDMTDSQWHHIKELFENRSKMGRPRELDLREVVNAILYVLATGCQWRYLPVCYPKWQSVYYYFRKARGRPNVDKSSRPTSCRSAEKGWQA